MPTKERSGIVKEIPPINTLEKPTSFSKSREYVKFNAVDIPSGTSTPIEARASKLV